MAKRGYRGKHPHNDMKVSKNSESTSKRNPKLDAEYDKLHPKQKYSYIRDHQGFFPQASADIVCHANIGNNSQLTMSAFDGTILMISGAADDSSNLGFKSDGTDAQAAQGIRDAVNINLAGKITASVSSGTVTLTQEAPGPDGNTTITKAGTWTNATVPTSFTGG